MKKPDEIITEYSSSFAKNMSETEKRIRKDFFGLFRQCPIPENELLSNLGLFIKRQDFTRMLFLADLYSQIVAVHGVIMEFGTRWGQNMALMQSLRGIYEPYNHTRKIIGFDTFEGLASVGKKDGDCGLVTEGALSVPEGYEEYLEKVLQYHERESPLSHMRKFEIKKGDASKTIEEYLEKNPETIVAFAYFDFDIYEPTKNCLAAIKDRVTKGSVIAFDQLNYHDFPGETIALKESLGLDRYSIRRSRFSGVGSYIVIE